MNLLKYLLIFQSYELFAESFIYNTNSVAKNTKKVILSMGISLHGSQQTRSPLGKSLARNYMYY